MSGSLTYPDKNRKIDGSFRSIDVQKKTVFLSVIVTDNKTKLLGLFAVTTLNTLGWLIVSLSQLRIGDHI